MQRYGFMLKNRQNQTLKTQPQVFVCTACFFCFIQYFALYWIKNGFFIQYGVIYWIKKPFLFSEHSHSVAYALAVEGTQNVHSAGQRADAYGACATIG